MWRRITEQVTGLASVHRNLNCVPGAHSHMNMRVNHDGVDFITVSSLIETPFEAKLFEVTSERIGMTTISLGPALAFDAEYDVDKSFVQGRPVDRPNPLSCGRPGARAAYHHVHGELGADRTGRVESDLDEYVRRIG
jgi:hypothetical protein